MVSSCSLEVQASSFVERTYTGIRAAVALSRGVSSGRPTPTAQATSIVPHIGRKCQAQHWGFFSCLSVTIVVIVCDCEQW